MAGIEKVCEAVKEGHWGYGTDFSLYKNNGASIYQDNIQVCLTHREELAQKAKNKKHKIWIKEYRIYSNAKMWDFWIDIEGVPCPYTNNGLWHRWFFDKRRWKRNMKKLLGVSELNIVKGSKNDVPSR